MRVRLPRAVAVALVAVLAVGCGAQVRASSPQGSPDHTCPSAGTPRRRAAGKPFCRREAEAFRPLLARRTAHCGNRVGSLSR